MHFLCLRNTHCKLLLQGRSFCTNVVKEGLITVILCCVEELVGPYVLQWNPVYADYHSWTGACVGVYMLLHGTS